MEKSSKIAKIVLWVLFGLSILLFILLLTSIESQTNPGARAEKLITLSIYWSEFLVIVGALIALGYAAKQMVSNKKQALTSLLILAGFALVIIVSWAVSSSEIPHFFGVEKFVADGSLTPSISRWIGTGLVTTYILFAGAALSVVGFSVVKMFKRS